MSLFRKCEKCCNYNVLKIKTRDELLCSFELFYLGIPEKITVNNERGDYSQLIFIRKFDPSCLKIQMTRKWGFSFLYMCGRCEQYDMPENPLQIARTFELLFRLQRKMCNVIERYSDLYFVL